MNYRSTFFRPLFLLLAGVLFLTQPYLRAQSPAPAHLSDVDSGQERDLSLLASARLLVDEPDLSVKLFPTVTPTALKLLIDNQTRSALSVVLLDKRHQSLYEHSRPGHKSWGWWHLDVSQLPDGPYTLQIRAGKHRVTRTFLVETRPPVVYAHSRTITF